MNRWMSQLPSYLLDTPLNNLAIPGSHDSFTCSLDERGPLGPDTDSSLKDLCNICGCFARPVIAKWSRTQSWSIADQLFHGIRYFDFRVSTKVNCEQIYFLHSLYGNPVDETLDIIASFLKENPGEVVLLDFNHFYGMETEHHMLLLTLLLSMFEGKIVAPRGMKEMTLRKLREEGLQVVVFYQNVMASEICSDFWPACLIRSPWANSIYLDFLMKFLDTTLQKRCDDTFYVTQAVLTPDLPYILAHLSSSLQAELAAKVPLPLIKWLKTKNAGPCGINICIMDFVESPNYIQSVIDLNLKLCNHKCLPVA